MKLKRKLPSRSADAQNEQPRTTQTHTLPLVPRRRSSAEIVPPPSFADDVTEPEKPAEHCQSSAWDLDELVRFEDKRPAWQQLFKPSTVSAIKAAAEAEGVPAETYIELATLRQLAHDME